MSHTPGPWKWLGEPGDSSLVGPKNDEDYVLLHADYEGLAIFGRLDAKRGWHDSEVANARLIAAAPELLRELQNLVAELSNSTIYDVTAARAAIARATGESK